MYDIMYIHMHTSPECMQIKMYKCSKRQEFSVLFFLLPADMSCQLEWYFVSVLSKYLWKGGIKDFQVALEIY